MTRLASYDDKEELKALWQSCFHEEQPFLSWFFDERFLPEYCALKTVDGQIVSALHGLPVHARIRDTLLPAMLVSGVATREDMRGRGYMREVFTYYMHALREAGVAAALYHPVDAAVYASLGQYACADAQWVTSLDAAPPPKTSFVTRACDLHVEACALYRCYAAFARRYSCVISRSYADFVYKCEDYLSGGGKCVAVYDGPRVVGYCVYFLEGDALLGDECVALSDAAYAVLRRALSGLASSSGKTLRLRLPPDVRLNGVGGDIAPHSLIGAVNIPMLLAATGLETRVPIAVTDAIVPENNGVFLPNGNVCADAPQLRVSAGRLAQWLVGYRSMADIVAAGEATLLHPDAAKALDRIGKRACYLLEEY